MSQDNKKENNNNTGKSPSDNIFEVMEGYFNSKSPEQEKSSDSDTALPLPADAEKALDDASSNQTDQNANTANINPTALTNHFSNQEVRNFNTTHPLHTGELNITAHLTETSETEISKVLEDKTPNNSDLHFTEEKEVSKSHKVVRILKKTWYGLTNISFLAKAVVYIAVVLILSAFCSFYAITVANDVFAFVKTDRDIIITVPENATNKQISYLLMKNDVIEYDWMFNLFLIYQQDGDQEMDFLPGEITVNPKFNYSQLIDTLTTVSVAREQVSITIPEGFTVDQIIELFVSDGIGTREGFTEAINNYPFKHEFVTLLESNGYSSNRKYRLEGYLYPDTYFFYKDSAEHLIINKMLNNFNTKFWSYYKSTFKETIDKTGFSYDDIVTLASMIQAEAKYYIDYESISYVFWNRLKHKNSFPFLQSDATIQYVLDNHTEDLTQADLDLDNPYNTYLYKGLPPGAICNPGFDALSAAVYPDAPLNSDGDTVNAYFFVSNKIGTTYYAETLPQHNKNKKQVAKDNQNFEAND